MLGVITGRAAGLHHSRTTTLAGTGVTISPTSGNNVTVTTAGAGTVTIDSPGAAGAAINIGTATPSSAGYVYLGTTSAPGTTVRANLDIIRVTGAGTATCTGTSILLSGGCGGCTTGITSMTFNSATQPTAVTCVCNGGTVASYAICVNR
jgi:hypothetical protein